MMGERGVEQNDLIRKGKQKGKLWMDGKEMEQEDKVGVEAKEKLLGETAKIKGHLRSGMETIQWKPPKIYTKRRSSKGNHQKIGALQLVIFCYQMKLQDLGLYYIYELLTKVVPWKSPNNPGCY